MLEILQALMNGNNDIRRHAEAQFDAALKTNAHSTVLALTAFCANAQADVVLRSLAMVILRRILYRQSELWDEILREDTKAQVQHQLLVLLASSDMVDKPMRRKLCDSISMVAMMTWDDDKEWPDLITILFHSVTTSGASQIQKENSLRLFTNLADSFHKKFSSEFGTIATLLNILASNTEPSLDVRIAAVRAAWCLVLACNEDTENDIVSPFRPLVSTSLDVVTAAIIANHPLATDPIEDMIDLAGSVHARLFTKKDIERTLHMMLELATIKTNRSSTSVGNMRLLAVEFIVTLMETRSAAIRKIRPPENAAVQALFPILINMMMELPDLREPELRAWGSRYPAHACSSSASQHDEDEEDCAGDVDFEVFGASLDYVDRVTRAMKPKHVLPIVLARATELIQQKDSNWKYPHSAMLMLAYVVEFMPRKEPELEQLCRTAAMFASDHPHMRVRHAAYTLLARLAFDCAPDVQARHSAILVGAFLKGLADPVPRVQAHAAIALANFCTACQDYEQYEVALAPYLGDVVNSLFTALQTSPTVVQENIITTLAAVARTAEEGYLPYYASMPILKSALSSLVTPAQYALKARLIDCIAVIGTSVGKQVFAEDAMWLLGVLEQTPLVGDDPEVQHIQAAWMALGQVLGEDLAPFLHKIVPFTIQMANKPIDREDEDDDGEEIDRETQIELHKVRTAAVDDRLLALEMLCCFAIHTKKAFLPFLEETLAIFFRDCRIENCENDDVRGRIAAGFPDLIRCALTGVEAGVVSGTSFGSILVNSLEVLCVGSNSEDTMDNLGTMVRSIHDILAAVYPLVLQSGSDACPDYVEACCAVLVQLLRDSVQRRALEFAALKCDTADDELDEEAQADYEEKVQEEHELHYVVSAAIGALIKANPQSFIPKAFITPAVGEHVFDLAHHVRLCHDQKTALYILDDLVEFAAKETIPPVLQRISEQLLISAKVDKSTSPNEPQSEVAQVVQAAVYGLGICADRFGNDWTYAADAARVLFDLISNAPKDLRFVDDYYGTCLDNAASAMLKIARSCPQRLASTPGALSQQTLLECWLHCMPLRSDMHESKFSSSALIQMLEERSIPYLLSPQALPLVVRAFANMIGTDYLDDRHVNRALTLLEAIKAEIGSDAFNRVVETVPKEQLQRLAQRVTRNA